MFSWHCLPPCVLPIESRDISERKKTGGRRVRVRAKSEISPIVEYLFGRQYLQVALSYEAIKTKLLKHSISNRVQVV